MNQTIAILFGGASTEYEVSLRSAYSVIQNFLLDRYEYVLIGITKDGEWYLYSGDMEQIPSGEWVNDIGNTRAYISPDRSVHGIILPELGQEIKIDACFPVLHGKHGEDGTVQGLLQMAGIPVVGCRTAASAVCMDKIHTKEILAYYGIPQAKWTGFTAHEYESGRQNIIDKISALGYPCFIKPANAGSSVGVAKVYAEAELDQAVRAASQVDSRIIAEENVDGQEIECAVLGNEDAIVSGCGEIIAGRDFYDYEAKYIDESSRLLIPAQISGEKSEEIRKTALKAYHILGCRGMARVDFFLRKSDGAVILNELNTIPGFTEISMYSKLLMADGIAYTELIARLIEAALS